MPRSPTAHNGAGSAAVILWVLIAVLAWAFVLGFLAPFFAGMAS